MAPGNLEKIRKDAAVLEQLHKEAEERYSLREVEEAIETEDSKAG